MEFDRNEMLIETVEFRGGTQTPGIMRTIPARMTSLRPGIIRRGMNDAEVTWGAISPIVGLATC